MIREMGKRQGKTYRQPVGHWPRRRAISIELAGHRRYPDSGGSYSTRPTSATFVADNDESDQAVRRAMHKQLDAMLDELLPKVPKPGPEWVMPKVYEHGSYAYDVLCHRVVQRRAGQEVKVACGTHVGYDVDILSISIDPPTHWNRCQSCLKAEAKAA